MMALLVWIFMVYGFSNIAVYGSVLNGFRNHIERLGNDPKIMLSSFFHFIREMMRCMMCFPTWLGFFVGWFIYSPTHEFLGVHQYGSWFFDGCLASGTTWVINSIIEWFEQNRPSNNNQIL